MKTEHGGQVQAYRAAEVECTEELGGQPIPAPLTTTEIGKMYDLEVEAYECLLGEGYEPLAPSTREAFIAEYESGDAWWAHSPRTPGTMPIQAPQCPAPSQLGFTWWDQ